jgi:YVTN family beta-propeller protein
MRRFLPLLILGLMAVVGVGCETAGRPAGVRGTARPGMGRLVITLNGPDRSPIDLTAELTGIMLHTRGGGWFEVPLRPLTLNSVDIVRRQIPLADVSMPAGLYDQLTLKFSKATLRQEGKVLSLSVPPGGFTFSVPIDVEPGVVASLFASWDVERAIEGEVFLAAAFTFEGKEPELRGVVAYVTNEEGGTVSVVDRANDRVVSTIQTGRAPRGIAVEPDTRRAFVLNGGDDTLTVIDVNTHRPVHTLNLEVRARAQDVAVSPRGQTLLVANAALNSVSILDSASFAVAATVPVGISPVSVAVDPRGSRVLVANQGSNSVSAIDTFTNRVVATTSIDAGPVHIAVDPNPSADRAFVASPASAFMSVLAVSTGQVVRRLNVGPGAVASIPDLIPNRLFVVKGTQNRVAVFDTTLNVEIGGFPVGRGPYRIALDPDRDKVFVVNRDGDSVTVADRLSRRVEATIPVGKRPYAIAVIR